MPSPKKPEPAPAAPAMQNPDQIITVQATEIGFYANKRRREGDVFTIKRSEFSATWMHEVPAGTPEHTSSSVDALRKEHEQLRADASPQQLTHDEPTGSNDPLHAREK